MGWILVRVAGLPPHSQTMLAMLAVIRLQYSQSLPWVILLIAGLSLLTLLAYPAQMRQVPRLWRWLPPTLRIFSISAISLSILRPAIVRARLARERAPIAVLLDNSRSMSVIDTNRSPGEWVGIAAAMGRLPADARDKKTAVFQADCDRLSAQADDVARARAELGYAALSGRGIESARSRLNKAIGDFQATARDVRAKKVGVNTPGRLEKTLAYLVQIQPGMDREQWLDQVSGKARDVAADAETTRIASDAQLYRSEPTVRGACAPLQSMSRLQLGASAVFDTDQGLLARLGSDTTARVFGISDQAATVELSGRTMKVDSLNADGVSSNLNGEIRRVIESMKASPPRAVVLLSDGRQVNSDNDPATLAAIQGIPVFTVAIAPHQGICDLSILSANVTASAVAGETVPIEVTMRARGLPRDTVSDVTLNGGESEQVQLLHFLDDRPVTFWFKAALMHPGLQKLSLDAAAVAGEVSLENNHVERWVHVTTAATRPAGGAATRPAGESEMVDLSGDEYFLNRLSNASGGQLFRLDQMELLARRLAEIGDDVTHPVEVPLWDGSYLFALVLGCLAAEWGVRKRWGLV